MIFMSLKAILLDALNATALKRVFLTLCLKLFLFPALLLGQDHAWWANNVNWDESTHWSSYITFSPGMMGSNALPIPEPLGVAKRPLGLSMGTVFAYNPEDVSDALYFNLALSPFSDRFQISFYGMPFEFFKTSHRIKTERKTFWRTYENNVANGDLQLNTYFRILEETFQRPQLDLRIHYRFPTSDNVGAARFTDTPGYFFDVGIEKTLINKRLKDKYLKKYFVNLGFYAWQTNVDRQFQNDAVVFGAGVKWDQSTAGWSIYTNGFIGYQNNGDQPVLVGVGRHFNGVIIKAEQGIHDYPFFRIKLEKTVLGPRFFNTFRENRFKVKVVDRPTT